MRILMLSQFYPPIIGGEEQHVRTLSIELSLRGHDVAVVTLWHQGLTEFELDQGVRVYRVRSSVQRVPQLFSNSGRQYAPPFPDPGVLIALKNIIKRERPQIVHAHNWLVDSFLPLKAWSKARLVVTLHNYNLVCVKTALIYHNTLCTGPDMIKCLRCATQFYGFTKGVPTVLSNRAMSLFRRGVVDMFLAVSQAVATGNGLVGSSLPFQIIPNFIPDNIDTLQGDSKSYLAQLPPRGYLLFVGALNSQKGVDILLRAYAGIVDAPPLVLIGYLTPEWTLLSTHRSPNVFLLTDWPRHAVIQAWYRSIVAIAPSVGPEACSTTAMEAMATGVPVIASRIGGFTDLVADGETGLLVDPGNPSALQQAIERLLADTGLRCHMGQAAQHRVVNFQASTVVPRIEQVYQEVLQS